jgi:hypothetical protein
MKLAVSFMDEVHDLYCIIALFKPRIPSNFLHDPIPSEHPPSFNSKFAQVLIATSN